MSTIERISHPPRCFYVIRLPCRYCNNIISERELPWSNIFYEITWPAYDVFVQRVARAKSLPFCRRAHVGAEKDLWELQKAPFEMRLYVRRQCKPEWDVNIPEKISRERGCQKEEKFSTNYQLLMITISLHGFDKHRKIQHVWKKNLPDL